MNLIEILNLQVFGDHRGSLISLEEYSECVPFTIKRVYFIFDTKEDVIRGKHAHKNLEQVIVSVSGECDFYVDNGSERAIIKMNHPSKALHIKSMVWREMTNFSKDCVLLVLASEHYDIDDYIFDYDEFLKMVHQIQGDN